MLAAAARTKQDARATPGTSTLPLRIAGWQFKHAEMLIAVRELGNLSLRRVRDDMTHCTPEASQRIAARIAGVTLLTLMIIGLMGIFARGGNLIVGGDPMATARNILGHERRFRVGLVCEFVMLNCDVVLALALFALLKPVNFTLALLGSFWRVADAFVLAIGVAGSLTSLDLLGNAHSVSLLSSGQLDGTAMMMFFNLHKQVSLMGLMFFCLGAGVHSWLLLRSGYIPRAISGLYLFASIEMLLCCFAFIVFPKSRAMLDPGFIVPDFFAELSAALWLAFKGMKLPVQEEEELRVP